MNAINAVRGWIAVGLAAAVAAAIGLGGQFLPVRHQQAADAAQPLVGRTTAVCTTGTLNTGQSTDSTESQVYGVAAKGTATGTGSLVGRELGDSSSGTPPLSSPPRDRARSSPRRRSPWS